MKRVIIVLVTALFFSLYSHSQTLHIFGGKEHKVYLGCLNCSNNEKESVWNINGDYGNYMNSKSIWNKQGVYGGVKSNFSPWNSLAEYPPVLRDKNGEFYGYLSVNEVNGYRAEFTLVRKIYDNHASIKRDVEGWYARMFSLKGEETN